MSKINFGSAENLVRIGLVTAFVSITFLMTAAFAETAKLFFWVALIILFFETFKLPSVSASNAAVAQMILAITVAVVGIKGLFASLGKTFTEHHIFLIMLIIGALVMLYGAYKKLS